MLDLSWRFERDKEPVVTTGYLLALVNVVDEYEAFISDLKKLDNDCRWTPYLCTTLDDAVKGELGFSFDNSKINKFCEKYKNVISKIREHCGLGFFVREDLKENGKFKEENPFYEYMAANREEIISIKNVLERIYELGISRVRFAPNEDFSKHIYEIIVGFNSFDYYYLDNIEVIPEYRENRIHYKTTHSPYEIQKNEVLSKKPSIRGSEIRVNTLLFDPNRLPKNLEKETIYDPIIRMKEEQTDTTKRLADATNLNMEVSDFSKAVRYLGCTINGLGDVKDKDELLRVLKTIQDAAVELSILSGRVNESVQEDELITKETLERSKQLLIDKRIWDSVDTC